MFAAPGQAEAAFLRSPHAFARIRSIDTAPAQAMPGVLAVLTARDMAAAGVGTCPIQCRRPAAAARA